MYPESYIKSIPRKFNKVTIVAAAYYGVCAYLRCDNARVLTNKIKKLVKIIDDSNYIVCHTGAGISTSCGIPDFRGPNGVWTNEKAGIIPDTTKDVPWESVQPSYTHMALKALHDAGKLKFIISQNVDGLHLRSGFPRNKLAELHGNVFKERCEKCHTEFFRPYDVKGIGFKYTGNVCSQPMCDGKLRDELLDWEDALPKEDLEDAEEQCERADLSLCLGTSLRVTPASELPLVTLENGGKMVIINLQKTEKDLQATLKINGYCDDIMKTVMENIKLHVPLYEPRHDFVVNKEIKLVHARKRVESDKDKIGDEKETNDTKSCQTENEEIKNERKTKKRKSVDDTETTKPKKKKIM